MILVRHGVGEGLDPGVADRPPRDSILDGLRRVRHSHTDVRDPGRPRWSLDDPAPRVVDHPIARSASGLTPAGLVEDQIAKVSATIAATLPRPAASVTFATARRELGLVNFSF